jgi:hypothetical protein
LTVCASLRRLMVSTRGMKMVKFTTTIRFTIDKNGRRRAHYWSLARRWLPISVEVAEFKVATGQAVLQDAGR